MYENRLRADQLAVGQPLPFDAYDSRGVLLLRRGSVISSTAQLERLIENGLYSDDPAAQEKNLRARALVSSYVPVKPPGARVSVVQSLAAAREGAEAMFKDSDAAHFPGRVLDLARQIRSLATLDPDAAIGNIVASRRTPYPARHAVNCTALGSLLLARQEGTEEQIEACLCALLTMNLAIVDLQVALYAQQAPMTEAQKAAMRSHPLRSVELLRARGVDHAPWLDAVLAHHELLDGSGYPGALGGDGIGRHARMLAIADQYCALVSERAFREGVNPSAALRHLLVSQGKGLDPVLCALLVREMTPYPPGAAVRLANGEIAVVCRRTRHPEQPIVRALISADGRTFPEPRKRVTSQAAYHVDKPVAQTELKVFPPAEQLWDDSFAAE